MIFILVFSGALVLLLGLYSLGALCARQQRTREAEGQLLNQPVRHPGRFCSVLASAYLSERSSYRWMLKHPWLASAGLGLSLLSVRVLLARQFHPEMLVLAIGGSATSRAGFAVRRWAAK